MPAPETDARKRLEAKTKLQAEFEAKAQKIHAISQLLKAYSLYQMDVEYVVQDNKVIIVDEHTGRLMPGRRWSDGLHQAVEAKEGVAIERETQTLATITIQNYFRLYQKLAGMTGTAETEAAEFFDIYKLGVLTIPTNKPNIRKDANDSVYKTKREKFNAVAKEIKTLHAQGRPILVGTISVETSEMLSRMLKKEGHRSIPSSTRNITSRRRKSSRAPASAARSPSPRTWPAAARTSNWARALPKSGGLHVLGTERHESRRIDRQLRGRCARQGDPGSSHFFISLEDDLMRLFGSDRIVKLMEHMGLEEGQELEHPLLNRSIQQAQKRVEQHNFQHAQTHARIRRRDEQAARSHLRLPQRDHQLRGRARPPDGHHGGSGHLDKVEQFTNGESEFSEWKVRALADWVNLNFPLGMPEAEIVKAARFRHGKAGGRFVVSTA